MQVRGDEAHVFGWRGARRRGAPGTGNEELRLAGSQESRRLCGSRREAMKAALARFRVVGASFYLSLPFGLVQQLARIILVDMAGCRPEEEGQLGSAENTRR